jgi:hypothetical protein
MILGYARVLTRDQPLDGQRDAPMEAGAGRLFHRHYHRHRPDLDDLLDQLRPGVPASRNLRSGPASGLVMTRRRAYLLFILGRLSGA